MHNERVKIEFVIGIENNPYNNIGALQERLQLISISNDFNEHLTPITGGLTFWTSQGFWAKNAHTFNENYEDSAKQYNIHLQVTVLPNLVNEVLAKGKEIISAFKAREKMQFEWVHIEMQSVQIGHFICQTIDPCPP